MRSFGAVLHYIAIGIIAIFILGAQPVLADVGFGNDVEVPAGKTVKEAVSIGNDVRVFGTVSGDAVAIGGNIIIEPGGEVEGNAVSLGGLLEIMDNAKVNGDVVTIFGRMETHSGAEIGGETVSVLGTRHDMSHFSHHRGGFGGNILKSFVLGPLAGAFGIVGIIISMVFSFVKLLFMIAVAALVTHFFPDQVVRMADCCKQSPGKAFLLGILVVVLIPLVVISFIITLIGIPLVPALLLFLFLFNLYGTVGVSLWAGRFLPNESNRSLLANTILGILVIWLVKLIPLVSIVVKIGMGLLAFGVVIMAHFSEKRGM